MPRALDIDCCLASGDPASRFGMLDWYEGVVRIDPSKVCLLGW
jgi:hypothetical protein